jgi:hypothetical protein
MQGNTHQHTLATAALTPMPQRRGLPWESPVRTIWYVRTRVRTMVHVYQVRTRLPLVPVSQWYTIPVTRTRVPVHDNNDENKSPPV